MALRIFVFNIYAIIKQKYVDYRLTAAATKTVISYFLLFICLRLAATTQQLFDLADVYKRKNVRIARNSNTMH